MAVDFRTSNIMTNFTLANKVNLNRKKMNKKIVKALFSYAVSKEKIRPLMQGVHFEEDVCVASDTYVLVVYKASNPALAGTTKLEDGTDIKGTYPAFKRVIPKKSGKPVNYNLSQVYRAIKWFKKQEGYNPNDKLVVNDCHIAMSTLLNALEVFNAAGDLGCMKVSTIDPSRPILLESEQLTAIVMPCKSEPEMVDLERQDCESVVVSYANLINTYAIESAKPKEAKVEMAWL